MEIDKASSRLAGFVIGYATEVDLPSTAAQS